MVSFTDYHDAISVGRLPLKTKFGKYTWYFHNSLLWKTEFSSTTKNSRFWLKAQKTNHSPASNQPMT